MIASTRTAPSSSLSSILTRLALLCAIDGLAIWLIVSLFITGVPYLALALTLILVFVNVVILRQELYPLRWMLVGLVLMALFSIYPIIFTVYVAFTNFGDGHLLSKEQAISQIQKEMYLPEGGAAFAWTAFLSTADGFVLWLQRTGEASIDEASIDEASIDEASIDEASEATGFIVLPVDEQPEQQFANLTVGPLDADGIPTQIEGYQRLNRLTVVRYINEIGQLRFADEDGVHEVQIRSLDEAAELEALYQYDAELDAMLNQKTGLIYSSVDGTFTAPNGDQLRPGYQSIVGFTNFERFLNSPALRGPLVRIIVWNFAFAFLSVFLTFAVGLAIAYTFNDPAFPGRKLIRSLLLIPYTIPGLITILIWRGMLNPEVGIINFWLENLFGAAPQWFTNPWWAKVGILLVNTWLGYPYFMLVCSGALQAIPADIYAAAEVDGANIWQRFHRITLPLLLVAVGPLLVASFSYNFNNFNLIFLFVGGGPPIAGASTRAGHTDILISYVYNLAFAGGRGAEYGLAAAITIIIFLIVATITLLQFRYTKMWEEVGENV